jgi:hypothetical protein
VDAVALDAAVRVAVHAAAGEMQREVAEVGAEHVSESDLRRAVRSGLQSQLGPFVHAECRMPNCAAWKGRLGSLDVAAIDGNTVLAGLEVKWCRHRDKVAEALWDALKLMPLTIDDGELAGAYLVYGAPSSAWAEPRDLPAELLDSGEHQLSDLLSRHEKHWRWLLTGNKSARPTELRSQFTTTATASVPIHNPHGEAWELRAARVQATTAPILFFDDGLVSKDQAAFGQPAPASRYVDGEDTQLDQATAPDNVELMHQIEHQNAGSKRPDASSQ